MREDFFYRIHIIPISLPPLRERNEDIPLLVDHFMLDFPDEKRHAISWHVMDALLNYDWPGNVRELRNVIQRYVTLETLDIMRRQTQTPRREAMDLDLETDFGYQIKDYQTAMEKFEKTLITKVLEQNNWHKEKTAKRLGLNRRTLFRRLNKLGLLSHK